MARATLRLMATSDIHMHLMGYDYYADAPMDGFGLTRIAHLLKAARQEVTNSLYFDNGDLLQGSPMGDVAAAEAMQPHPAYEALVELGCDAATLGNHEFNFGLEFLEGAVRDARLPIVSANIMRGEETLLTPSIVLDRQLQDAAGGMHAVRIGVTGMCPPQMMMWDKHHLEGRVTCLDIVDAAREAVADLRTKADLVIVLCHSGLDQDAWVEGMENALAPVSRIDGIDAIIAGHRHDVIPSARILPDGKINGVPVVMPGFWGSHLGIIDLTLDLGDGVRVAGAKSQLRATKGVPEDADLQRVLAPAHARTLQHTRRVVGQTSVPLHSYFAQVRPDSGLALIAEAQAAHVREALAKSRWRDLPVLSAVAAFKTGGRGGPGYFTDIPAGPLTMSGVSDLYVFPNEIRAVEVTGLQLRHWLERAAGRYARIRKDVSDQDLFDPEHERLEVDIMHGVSYEFDLSQPAMFDPSGCRIPEGGGRVRRLTFDGHPVQDGQRFVIATNNYRSSGGGVYPGADGTTEIYAKGVPIRDLLIDHVEAFGASAIYRADWSFTPLDVSVLFRSGPGGRAHLAGCADIEDTGRSDAGFALFRLKL